MAPPARLKGPRLDEYESNRNHPDLNTTAATNPPGDTATIDKTLRMASNIKMSVHHPALSRRTSDSAYAVLVNALPVGSRCYQPEDSVKERATSSSCSMAVPSLKPRATLH